jgi:hypothetical protein
VGGEKTNVYNSFQERDRVEEKYDGRCYSCPKFWASTQCHSQEAQRQTCLCGHGTGEVLWAAMGHICDQGIKNIQCSHEKTPEEYQKSKCGTEQLQKLITKITDSCTNNNP